MIADTLIKFEKAKTETKNTITKAINILWVDDEVEFLKPHIMYLRQNGYVVNTANNGLDAIQEISEHRYDVIFMDENMPGLSGIETISRIREINSNIPVVMITKNESERIMKEATKSYVTDYLVKPVSLTQIFVAVHKILNSNKSSS
jgi:DNA-binding response OmpR family regulator